jgi:hypothetical protein
MSPTQLKGAFKRISGKGDSVADKMSATFRALAGLADWDATATTASTAKPADEVQPAEPAHKPTARTPRQSPDVGQERPGFAPTFGRGAPSSLLLWTTRVLSGASPGLLDGLG